MMSFDSVNCGYLDNILYDFSNNVLPFDDFNNYEFDGLNNKEVTKIKKYYNLTLKHGLRSVYYLKLCYIVYEVILKYCKNFIGMVGYKRFKGYYIK